MARLLFPESESNLRSSGCGPEPATRSRSGEVPLRDYETAISESGAELALPSCGDSRWRAVRFARDRNAVKSQASEEPRASKAPLGT